MAAINIALLSPAGIALRRKYEVSLRIVMAVARTDAATADSGTGRNVQTSHTTGARRMAYALGIPRSGRTYRKARDIIRLLGFMVVIDEGRYLTKTERLEAALKADPNSRRPAQRRKASTRVFTMNQQLVEKIGHLPRRGSTTSNLTSGSTNQKRAKARRASPKPTKWELPLQRLAGKLVNEVTFLRSVHPRDICRGLDAAGISADWWTPHDVARAMYATVTGQRWTAPAELSNPVGYFRYLLSTITPEGVRAHVERKQKAAADRQERLASAVAAKPLTPTIISPSVIERLRAALRGKTIMDSPQPIEVNDHASA